MNYKTPITPNTVIKDSSRAPNQASIDIEVNNTPSI